MKKRLLSYKNILVLILSIVILSISNLFAQQPTFNWLGTIGGNFSRAFGVSANGSVVVGVSNTSNYEERAFRWTLANGMENLGTLGGNQSIANAVSADGSIIVGWSRDANDIKRAFKWTAATGIQDLGAGEWTDAVAISADGSVVVVNNGMDGFAYRWTANGMENLGTLGGNQTIAYDVSADGSVIIGFSYVAAGDPYAFRWTSGAGIQQIGTFYSFARGVSGDGNIVTGSETGAAGLHRAFRWTQSGGFEFNIAGNFSQGLAVSGDGSIIVGDGGDGAFRLSNAGGLEYLDQVYSNLLNPGSVLIDAVDISPNGLFIVGYGTNSLTGLDDGYLIAVNGVSAVNELDNNPKNFSLFQNYPNPFNPTTTITYDLPRTANVELKVYDILGNEIATLVNEEKPSGTYEIQFNPESRIKHPASGVYFYQLKAGNYLETKKMLMIK
jgi:probable HAF family extracellular repeat protein